MHGVFTSSPSVPDLLTASSRPTRCPRPPYPHVRGTRSSWSQNHPSVSTTPASHFCIFIVLQNISHLFRESQNTSLYGFFRRSFPPSSCHTHPEQVVMSPEAIQVLRLLLPKLRPRGKFSYFASDLCSKPWVPGSISSFLNTELASETSGDSC